MVTASGVRRGRSLGRTGLVVSDLCLGANPLGGGNRNYGPGVDFETGVATVLRCLESDVRFLDTAAGYSAGESDRRTGEALRRFGGVPEGFTVATKVDRDMVTGEFSGAQMRRSLEQSLERLGLDRVPLLYLHDPEFTTYEQAVAPGGPIEELARLRAAGYADHLGVAGGPVDLLTRYVELGVFEVVLTHSRWTLVDRSAGPLLERAERLGVAVVNAAPFGGGLFVGNPLQRYGYRPAPPAVLDSVTRAAAACAAYGVPLPAAALQFSARNERIVSTVVGASSPKELDEILTWRDWPVPDELWLELDRVAASSDVWLG